MRFSLIPVLLATAISLFAADQPFTGKVVAVTDGDTIRVMHDGVSERIRLNGIDAPESKQPFGSVSKRYVSDLAFGRDVTVQPHSKDRYGRTVADILLPDGRVLNQEIVKAGLAWWYRQYAPHDGRLEALEEQARHDKRGLWKDAGPVPPWEWRKPRKSGVTSTGR